MCESASSSFVVDGINEELRPVKLPFSSNNASEQLNCGALDLYTWDRLLSSDVPNLHFVTYPSKGQGR